MQVVAVIHHRVDARGRAALDVRLIRKRGFLVGLQRRFVVARADVDVRGHVHDVSRGGRQLGQMIRAGERALGRVGSLDRVNVIVNRAQVIGLAPNHGLQRRHNFFRALFRRSVRPPQAPRMQIHSGLREKRRRIKVVGKPLHHFAHRITILFRRGAQIRFGIAREALCQRRDVGLVAIGSVACECLRFLHRRVRPQETVFARGIVIIWTHRFREAPKRHS